MSEGVLAGARVDNRYTIEGEIGRGGFSIVYGATDEETQESIALKLLVPPPASAEVALERLRREVRAAQKLSHPSVARVYRLIEEPSRAFIVMERVPGKTLGALVAERGPLPPAEVRAIGVAVARALEHAHQSLILHRDVKPDNIVVPEDGPAKLVDFGSARIEGDVSLTRTGGFVGTLDYAAPEVLDGARPDARADVYGLGLSLYFALAGQLPKRSSIHLPPSPAPYGHRPSGIAPTVPPWLDAIVRRATMADPRHRFPTIAALRVALETHSADPGTLAAMRTGFCAGCGDVQTGPPRLCRRCESLPEAPGDQLLYVDLGRSGTPKQVKHSLDVLFGSSLARGAVGDVAAGHRPRVSVRGRDAERVIDGFRREGLHLLPRRQGGLHLRGVEALSLGAAGLTSALLLSSGLTNVGLLGVGLVIAASYLFAVGAKRPILARRPAPVSDALPFELWSKFSVAEAALQDPAMRGVLVDIAETAHQAAQLEGVDTRELHPRVRRLFEAAVAGAEALSRVDRALETTRRDAISAEPLARVEEARSALVQRLLESLATMTNLVVGAPGSAAAKELEAASADLARELELREEALAEVDALTKS